MIQIRAWIPVFSLQQKGYCTQHGQGTVFLFYKETVTITYLQRAAFLLLHPLQQYDLFLQSPTCNTAETFWQICFTLIRLEEVTRQHLSPGWKSRVVCRGRIFLVSLEKVFLHWNILRGVNEDFTQRRKSAHGRDAGLCIFSNGVNVEILYCLRCWNALMKRNCSCQLALAHTL